MTFIGSLMMIICVLMDTSQHLLFRTAARRPAKYWHCVLPACAIYVLALPPWFEALKTVPLVVASPLMAMSYVTIALFCRLLFKERVDALRWFGIVMVTVGAALLASHHP